MRLELPLEPILEEVIMFGLRRRHRKAQPAPEALPEPTADGKVQLSDEQLFTTVHKRLEEFMGVDGTWSLVRRDRENASDDSIFSSMSTILLAKDITSELLGTESSAATRKSDDVADDNRPAQTDAADLRDMLRPIPRADVEREQVSVELTAIATWADPQRHDPDHVDPKLLSPNTPKHEVRGA